MPLISVLIPAYNHAAYIGQAMDSVLRQQDVELELIVVDDASADETREVIRGFADPRVRTAWHEHNQGAHATINDALAMARGAYVSILNSDDVYSPGRLARLLEFSGTLDQETLIFTDLQCMDDEGRILASHERLQGYEELVERCRTLVPALWWLAGNPAMTTSNFFFPRSLAEKVGGFAPLRYTHDWDWAVRAAALAGTRWLHEPLLAYRVHAANTLAEKDVWRHIHENSHVQARALRLLAGAAGGDEPLLALLHNESLHPLALLMYLLAERGGKTADDLLAISGLDAESWWLAGLAEKASFTEPLFRSANFLQDALRQLEKVSRLAEERYASIRQMSGEIDERDRRIAAQTALVEEKDRGMAAQTALVKEKDRGMAEQARLLDERWQAMQEMGEMIRQRDLEIGDLQAMLEKLHNNPFVKPVLWLVNKFGQPDGPGRDSNKPDNDKG